MYFVLSDVHGCYNEMMTALSHWNPDNEHLIMLGDLVDRGPDSLSVIRHMMSLENTYPERVTVIKGNHEEMLTSWLIDTPDELLAYYFTNEHRDTLLSFFNHDHKKYRKSTRKQRAQHVRYKYRDELRYLYQLPYYYETEHCIFVHAGIDLTHSNWKDNTDAMCWVRNPFIYSHSIAPKKVFFGHTPTHFIHDEPTHNHNVWFSDYGDKIGIDGACSMGGQLNALRIDHTGHVIDTIVIPSNINKRKG